LGDKKERGGRMVERRRRELFLSNLEREKEK
jgi:hypothetical protein